LKIRNVFSNFGHGSFFFSSDDFSSSWNLEEILELEEHFENLIKTSWELYENTLGTNQKNKSTHQKE